jgi:hypothetical protein
MTYDEWKTMSPEDEAEDRLERERREAAREEAAERLADERYLEWKEGGLRR